MTRYFQVQQGLKHSSISQLQKTRMVVLNGRDQSGDKPGGWTYIDFVSHAGVYVTFIPQKTVPNKNNFLTKNIS